MTPRGPLLGSSAFTTEADVSVVGQPPSQAMVALCTKFGCHSMPVSSKVHSEHPTRFLDEEYIIIIIAIDNNFCFRLLDE